MIVGTIAKQVVEFTVNGVSKGVGLVKSGLSQMQKAAQAAAGQIDQVLSQAAKIAKVGAGIGAGFLAGFGKKAMEGTVEADRLGQAWEYLSRVVGNQLGPYVRVLTTYIVKAANAYRELSPEVKDTVIQVALFAAGIGAALVILPTIVSVVGAFGAAILAIASPAAIAIAGIAAIVDAATGMFDFFREEAPATSEAVDEANYSWPSKAIDYIKKFAMAAAKLFNQLAKQAADASDQIADGWASALEFLSLVPDGTTEAIRQMDKIKPYQIDIDALDRTFESVKRMAKSAGLEIKKFNADIGNELEKEKDKNPGLTRKFSIQFEGMQNTFDRLQSAIAGNQAENFAKQQVDLQKMANNLLQKITESLTASPPQAPETLGNPREIDASGFPQSKEFMAAGRHPWASAPNGGKPVPVLLAKPIAIKLGDNARVGGNGLTGD